MSDAKIKWTPKQDAAINADSADITVAASAGTGKTSVLSSRCLRILSDPSICSDVSELLVLTFTEAAAGQMGSRIAKRIKDALAVSKDRHLRKQLLLLDSADISTIHAFCKRTISRYFHRLGLDPSLRLIDEDEQKLIKSEILAQTIEQAWGEEALAKGMQVLLAGRKITDPNNSFLNIIIEIATFLDNCPSRQSFFDRAMILSEANAQATQNLHSYLLEKLTLLKSMLEHSLYLDAEFAEGHWQDHIQNDYIQPLDSAIDALGQDKLQQSIKIIKEFKKTKWKPKPKGFDAELKVFIQAQAQAALKEFKALADLPGINPDYQKLVAPHLSIQTRTLIELVKLFDRNYQRAKTELGCLDFSDLEHKMLQLLCKSDDASVSEPSEIAMQLRQQYKYIFVDEFQDINPVQQRIIDLISSGRNVFVVGDVKQSIYAWRGADCGLFLQRLIDAQGHPQKTCLNLNENFRSNPGILEFVNSVFAKTMTSKIASLDYDDDAALRSPQDGHSARQEGSIPVEILLLEQADSSGQTGDDSSDDSTISDDVTDRATLVAQRIKQLMADEKFKVYDKNTKLPRALKYSDIAVLMRSFSNRANDYVQVFRSAEIPVISASSVGYFQTTEINDMLSLLRVLDNPLQDIELAAVLRGPFFQLTETEIATIQTSSKENLFMALNSYSQSGSDISLAEKLKHILWTIDQWRSSARQGMLSDLIWHIYRRSRYLSAVLALPGGKQRHANLMKLHQRAVQFEGFATSAKTISLARFVDFLEKLISQGGDWAPEEPDSTAEDAVRITSVHRSKGLEFPVVILAEMNSPFSKKDKQSECLTDSEHAIGLKVIDPETKAKLPSLAWQMISDRKGRTTLAEEMRILYVAMTRARDHLILTGSCKNKKASEMIAKAAICGAGKLPEWLLKSAQCHLDWIFFALAKDSKLAGHFKPLIDIDQTDSSLFTLKVSTPDQVNQFRGELFAKAVFAVPGKQQPDLIDKIKANLSWEYPFEAVAKIPAKNSVSSLSHSEDEFKTFDYTPDMEKFSAGAVDYDPMTTGSATHLLIQKLDLSAAIDLAAIEDKKNELTNARLISPEAAKRIDTDSISKFFASPLGSEALDSANSIFREWPFTIAIPAVEIYPELSVDADEKIIIQGIIDMLIKTPDGAVVIDFKTDRIASVQAGERAQRYRKQINYYSRAVREVLKTPVTAAYIYFLGPALAIDIPQG